MANMLREHVPQETRIHYVITKGGEAPNVVPAEAEVMDRNLRKVGGVNYTDEERKFAEEIMKSYPDVKVSPEDARDIADFIVTERAFPYSTDVGDVSWLVPTAGMSAATWVPGTSAHSWQAVAAGGMSIGHKGMMVAAKTMALSAVEIYKNPSVVPRAQKELKERQGVDFIYEALLGSRNAPLDYRDN